MIKLNVEFIEEYKRLDNLCKQCFDSKDGVTEYISQMESEWDKGIKSVNDWQSIYKKLKHVRYIRNQLAHDSGTLNSNIVEKDDLDFVKDFYNQIIKTKDPLTLSSKAKKIISTPKSRKNNKRRNKKSKKSFIKTLFYLAIIALFIYIISKYLG